MINIVKSYMKSWVPRFQIMMKMMMNFMLTYPLHDFAYFWHIMVIMQRGPLHFRHNFGNNFFAYFACIFLNLNGIYLHICPYAYLYSCIFWKCIFVHFVCGYFIAYICIWFLCIYVHTCFAYFSIFGFFLCTCIPHVSQSSHLHICIFHAYFVIHIAAFFVRILICIYGISVPMHTQTCNMHIRCI